MIEHGIAPERLQVSPEGATDFVEPGTTESEHEQNRRVVFRVLKLKEKANEKEKASEPEQEPAPEQNQRTRADAMSTRVLAGGIAIALACLACASACKGGLGRALVDQVTPPPAASSEPVIARPAAL